MVIQMGQPLIKREDSLDKDKVMDKEEECGRTTTFEGWVITGLVFWWIIFFLFCCRVSVWIFMLFGEI